MNKLRLRTDIVRTVNSKCNKNDNNFTTETDVVSTPETTSFIDNGDNIIDCDTSIININKDENKDRNVNIINDVIEKDYKENDLNRPESSDIIVTDNIDSESNTDNIDSELNTDNIDIEFEDYIDMTVDNLNEYLEEVPIYKGVANDLYKKSLLDFVGYLVRFGIMGILSLVFLYWTFHTKYLAIRSIGLTMSLGIAVLATIPDIVLKYSIKNVLWFNKCKVFGIDKLYMGYVTGKLNMKKSNRNFIIVDDKYHLEVLDSSEYSEVNLYGVVLVIVKDNSYHVISMEELLGTKVENQSFKDFMK